MRWLTFLVLMVFALILQSALAPRLELLGIRPDLLLVFVIFFSMHAAPREAVLGAWLTGACADLLTIERFGVLALSYGLAAVLTLSFRDYLFRGHGWPQFVTTVAVCLLVRLAWLIYHRAMYDPGGSVLVELTAGVVAASVYTAVWAPLAQRVLLPWWRMLGMPRPAYVPGMV
ncbi:MAG: rod shape-determining protein MreD [Phycisphaerae bacterium]|jgi:rod shape-determining protein MreD